MKLGTSTKALLIAALAIIVLFLVGDFFGFSTNSTEPRTYVMELDTAAVVSIRFEDRADSANNFGYGRLTDKWVHSMPQHLSVVTTTHANEILERFRLLKVKRTMGMTLLLGERYSLTDSTLCRITFTDIEGKSHTLDLGSSTFAPGKVGSWTYVNVPGEREVYAVEGLLATGLRSSQEATP